jgi:hypothetical protein
MATKTQIKSKLRTQILAGKVPKELTQEQRETLLYYFGKIQEKGFRIPYKKYNELSELTDVFMKTIKLAEDFAKKLIYPKFFPLTYNKWGIYVQGYPYYSDSELLEKYIKQINKQEKEKQRANKANQLAKKLAKRKLAKIKKTYAFSENELAKLIKQLVGK